MLLQISSLTDPQQMLEEMKKQTSGELTPVDVIAYTEALSRAALNFERRAHSDEDVPVKEVITVTLFWSNQSDSHEN